MEAIKAILDWVSANWAPAAAVAVLVFAAVRGVVLLTPTKADDTIFDKVVGYIRTIAGLFGKKIDIKKTDEQ